MADGDRSRGDGSEELIRRYSKLVRTAVVRVAGAESATIVDDVEQKVAVALWQAMPNEQMPSHPSSYLYRAAVRETVRALKELHRVALVELDEERRDPLPDPEQQLESRQLGDAIRAAFSTLSQHRRRAVQAHLMGYDVQEIMSMQGWSYNRARNLIARGMADLRRELARRGFGG